MFRGISFRLVTKLISRAPNANICKKVPINSLLQSRTPKYPTSWYTSAKFCTSNSQSITTSIISENTLDVYISRIDKELWNNVIEMLMEVSNTPSDMLNQEKIAEFYNKIENRFMEKERYLVQPRDLVELAYTFGSTSFGSNAFWNKLLDKFLFLHGNNKLTFEELARFLSGASNQVLFDSKIWTMLEQSLIRNPIVITPSIIGYMLPCLVRTYLKQGNNAALNPGGHEDVSSLDLEANQLWMIFKDAALKEVSNMDKGELASVCWSLTATKYKEEGFWMLAEQRFNEIKPQLLDHEYAEFAYCFGIARQGSPDFWQEMEGHILNNINNLTGLEIRKYINGLAKAEEGTLRLWNELQKSILNIDLSLKDLSFIIHGFGIFEITNPKTWDYLEEQTLAKMNSLGSNELTRIITGFSTAERGEESLWNAIEERILNMDDLSSYEKLAFYILFKSTGRLSTNLSSYLEEVADAGDEILRQSEEQEQGEEDENEERNQML